MASRVWDAPLSMRRATMATCAPSPAKEIAVAAPIPRVPPVTNAILSDRFMLLALKRCGPRVNPAILQLTLLLRPESPKLWNEIHWLFVCSMLVARYSASRLQHQCPRGDARHRLAS